MSQLNNRLSLVKLSVFSHSLVVSFAWVRQCQSLLTTVPFRTTFTRTIILNLRMKWLLGPVSRKSRERFGPEKMFYVCRDCIQYQSFNNFENDTVNLSVNEANLLVCELGTLLLFNWFWFQSLLSNPKSYRVFRETKISIKDWSEQGSWGSFLESPVNFSGPKSNIQIEIKRIRARVLARKNTPFCFVNWYFYLFRCKTIETSTFYGNRDSLPGPLIIGTFEKRAPGQRK